MDFQRWYESIPKLTRGYMIAILATTFIQSYIKVIPVGQFIYFDWDKILSGQVMTFKLSI